VGLIDPPGFRRNRHGQVWVHLGEDERDLLRDLLDQLAGLIAPDEPAVHSDPLAELVGIDASAQRPTDPALLRLFPDAYADPELADEFRRFTSRDLHSAKRERIEVVIATLHRPDPTRLTAEECLAWLGALNDLRLTLGARLGISQDGDHAGEYLDRPPGDPVRSTYLVYDWLTYHQDRLVRALERGLPR
jgi:hypothetical protein